MTKRTQWKILLRIPAPGFRQMIEAELAAQQFTVVAATNESEADEADAVVIDAAGDEQEALDVMLRIVSASRVPIVCLTRNDVRARIRALELGAISCLSSPCIPDELAASLRAVLRAKAHRTDQDSSQHVRDVRLNREKGIALVDGSEVRLSERECAVLTCLMRHRGQPVGKAELMKYAYPGLLPDAQLLRTVVDRLRRKLEAHPSHPTMLKTVRGVGYSFVPPTTTAVQAADPHAERNGCFVHAADGCLFASIDEVRLHLATATRDLVNRFDSGPLEHNYYDVLNDQWYVATVSASLDLRPATPDETIELDEAYRDDLPDRDEALAGLSE